VVYYTLQRLGNGVPPQSKYWHILTQLRGQLLAHAHLLKSPAYKWAIQAKAAQAEQFRARLTLLRAAQAEQLRAWLEKLRQERELQARLLQHLWYQPEENLRDLLRDNDPTIRSLTAQVVNGKRLHFEGDLIELLGDESAEVRESARLALVRLGRGVDFGPAPKAKADERTRAADRWREWLALQDPPAGREILGVAGPALTPRPSEPGGPSAPERKPAAGALLRTVDEDAARLGRELVAAPADRRAKILDGFREGRGAAYTEALAQAIPQLRGEARTQARDALAGRLARMTAATLRDKLADADAEVRRAAALACAMREDKGHVPDLLSLLEDAEAPVAAAARAALRELTGQDFGPQADASRAERSATVAAWRAWWQQQMK
jgi:hypothetical protein